MSDPILAAQPKGADVLIVVEPWAFQNPREKDYFDRILEGYGLQNLTYEIVDAYPMMPQERMGQDRLENDWAKMHRGAFLQDLNGGPLPKLIIAMGKGPATVCAAGSIKITRARGQVWHWQDMPCPVLVTYSPAYVLRMPDKASYLETDLFMLKRLVDHSWNPELLSQRETDYRWCTDLQFLLDMEPKVISVDTETTGLRWYKPEVVPLTVQISWGEGKAICVPVDREFWPELSQRGLARVIGQLKSILENPKIKKVGHNLSYDFHILSKLGIRLENVWMDTIVGAFAADDNMQEKSLDECVRRWVPAMAGYADVFNQTTDKGKMREVPRDKFLRYAAGDADASLRLANVLFDTIRVDKRQWNLYNKVQMPALRAFMGCLEEYGVKIDTTELARLQTFLDEEYFRLYSQLIDMVPRPIKRLHAEKGLKFSRDAFVRDILFHEDGFGLTPIVFTDSTKNKAPEERIPSVAAKTHLSYFDDHPFVYTYLEFAKVEKMRSTYVGKAWDEQKQMPTGFWQYLFNDEIHPSFNIHGTVTGRSSSRDPNAQNFPKRGTLAKAYRKIFVPREGYTFIEADLSQAELRVAAWMANETTMLGVYARDGDIHAMTAAAVMGLTLEQFMALDDETRDFKRFQAKAVNFGFLYGMGWRKFKAYAKTDYGLTYTDEEAQETRRIFFETYPGLEEWHKSMRGFVNEHLYVRALHGALRRLPNVGSNDEIIQSSAQRQAINSPVQRFASDLGLMAMARFVRDCPKDIVRPVMFVHDALVLEVRNDMVEEGASAVRWYMQQNPLEEMFGLIAPIPIKADVKVGPNLKELADYNVEARPPSWWNQEADYGMAA